MKLTVSKLKDGSFGYLTEKGKVVINNMGNTVSFKKKKEAHNFLHYLVLWNNPNACDTLPEKYKTYGEAQKAGEFWEGEIKGVDPEAGENDYWFEVVPEIQTEWGGVRELTYTNFSNGVFYTVNSKWNR